MLPTEVKCPVCGGVMEVDIFSMEHAFTESNKPERIVCRCDKHFGGCSTVIAVDRAFEHELLYFLETIEHEDSE